MPIPTYYGDEICRVDGMKYAKDMMLATIRSRLHLLNIFYDRKFDIDPVINRHYSPKLSYASSHTMAVETVPPGSRVLDVGCGPGHVAGEPPRRDAPSTAPRSRRARRTDARFFSVGEADSDLTVWRSWRAGSVHRSQIRGT